MKILKKILIVVVILIAIPLVIALFVKKEYAVEREVTINKPKQVVFNYVKHLKNQDNYNKWVRMDPNMKKDFRGGKSSYPMNFMNLFMDGFLGKDLEASLSELKGVLEKS